MAVPQVWDDLLAQTARKWALRCELGHDANRDEPGQYNTVYHSYRCHDTNHAEPGQYNTVYHSYRCHDTNHSEPGQYNTVYHSYRCHDTNHSEPLSEPHCEPR